MKILIICALVFLAGCAEDEKNSYLQLSEWESENQRGGIMFVGDSIIAGWPSELLPEGAVNRGICGDSAAKMRGRTWLIIQESPDLIYLLIGTNDLAWHNKTVDTTIYNIEMILQEVTTFLPDVQIYIFGLLPNKHTPHDVVIEMNSRLNETASYFGIEYIHVFDLFYKDGEIVNTLDGVHPNLYGYILMIDRL